MLAWRDVWRWRTVAGLKRLVRAGQSAAGIDGYVERSWSQEGEDLILSRIFEHRKRGFYIDVGAHHPQRFSNTFRFYQQGWEGINLDAMPGSMRRFDQLRPRDTNLEIAIGTSKETASFYVFEEQALNTFDPMIAKRRAGHRSGARLLEVIEIRCCTLAEVLQSHLPGDTHIDFLTIDVEGRDLEVIQSNDWGRFRPHFVLIEIIGSSIVDVQQEEIHQYLVGQGYEMFAKTVNTVFFRDTRKTGAV